MKTLKFREKLSKLILNGEKIATWRLFDNKNLRTGDNVSFLVWENKKEFAKAKLIEVKEKKLSKLTKDDWKGHEKFSSKEEMYKTYSLYYEKPVNKDSLVKMIHFKLI